MSCNYDQAFKALGDYDTSWFEKGNYVFCLISNCLHLPRNVSSLNKMILNFTLC